MKTKKNATRTETFELVINGTPMLVKATSFLTYTMETQYRVSINGGPVYIFGWNPELKRIAAIGRGSAVGNISSSVEDAIGSQLYVRMAA